jgi:hypothetical protein
VSTAVQEADLRRKYLRLFRFGVRKTGSRASG